MAKKEEERKAQARSEQRQKTIQRVKEYMEVRVWSPKGVYGGTCVWSSEGVYGGTCVVP